MKTTITILSFLSGFLISNTFFEELKIDKQRQEIKALESRVDSLKYEILLDSIPIKVDSIFKKLILKK